MTDGSSAFPDPREAGQPRYQMTRWTTEDGLPSNTIRALTQTRDGYLWVATKAGLVRFNGVSFRVFKDELRIRPTSELSCAELAEDTQSRLWMRTQDGLLFYQRGTFRKIPTEALPWKGVVTMMVACSTGGLWVFVQNEGLKLFDGARIVREWNEGDGLGSVDHGALREDGQGGLWISTGRSLGARFQRLDLATGEIVPLEKIVGQEIPGLQDLQPAPGGELWLSAAGFLLHYNSGRLSQYPAKGVWNESRSTGILTSGETGSVWFAPPEEETVVKFENGQFHRFQVKDGLADTDIRVLFSDREGNLWIGFGSGGLQRLRQRGLSSVLTSHAPESRMQIDSIAQTSDNALWFGSWAGLWRSDSHSLQHFMTPIPGRNDVRVVLPDRTGQIWLGTRHHGLFTLLSNKITAVNLVGPTTNWSARALFEDRAGILWIASNKGLFQKTATNSILFTSSDGLANDDVLGICESSDGALWVGTAGGLQTFRNGVFKSIHLDDQNAIGSTPLLAEADGSVWIVTYSGLRRVSANGVVGRLTEHEGLYSNDVFCLLDDLRGYYWANSPRGIFRFRKEDAYAVADGRKADLFCVSYGEADGALTAEGSGEAQPNACRASDGRLWFSSTRGAVVVDPAALIRRDVPPLVVIEEVWADQDQVFIDGANRPASPRDRNGDLRLPPRRAHGLEVRYTANSFVAPEKVRFRFRLEGVDRDWQQAGIRRTAFYTNLRPGYYEFLVEAFTQEGTWSEAPAVFPFSIAPSFFETAWFPGLCAFALTGAGVGFGYWRLRWQRRVLLAEQSANLERERSRIARDLHDDLGTALTGLALELDVIGKDASPSSRASGRLAGTAARTRQLAERMREAVWAVNPRCDTVESLASYLEQQTAQFLHADGIRGRLEFPENIPARRMDSDTRHQLALAVREALSNVLRHARATEVTVKLAVEQESLHVRITDNGIGCSASGMKDAEGSGLGNMRERMERIGGSFDLQSASSGTTVTLQVPLRRYPENPRA